MTSTWKKPSRRFHLPLDTSTLKDRCPAHILYGFHMFRQLWTRFIRGKNENKSPLRVDYRKLLTSFAEKNKRGARQRPDTYGCEKDLFGNACNYDIDDFISGIAAECKETAYEARCLIDSIVQKEGMIHNMRQVLFDKTTELMIKVMPSTKCGVPDTNDLQIECITSDIDRAIYCYLEEHGGNIKTVTVCNFGDFFTSVVGPALEKSLPRKRLEPVIQLLTILYEHRYPIENDIYEEEILPEKGILNTVLQGLPYISLSEKREENAYGFYSISPDTFRVLTAENIILTGLTVVCT